MPLRLDPSTPALPLAPGGTIFVQGCSGESTVLADAVRRAGPGLGSATFCGIFVPGLNRYDYLANPGCRVTTWFMTPELKRAGAAVDFRPLCYADILADLGSRPIDAALVMLAPPDDDGLCSFGPVVDFLPEIWERIPRIVAHLNPSMPRTRGTPGIPLSRLAATIEVDQPLLGQADEPTDAASRAIGDHIAGLISDGATLQVGLGKIPSAVLRALVGHRDLRIHSGLIPQAVLDLLSAGALAPGVSVTGGVAIGGPELYAACGGEAFRFLPVSHTHSASVIAGIERFVSINSALEVDLYGQAHAERGPRGWMSGPGGASDFARGARLGGGPRIVALPAAAEGGAKSRIVAPNAASGPVSLGRFDIDVVVTEHGVADLRGQGHDERARRLIAIAGEAHRESLTEAWRKI